VRVLVPVWWASQARVRVGVQGGDGQRAGLGEARILRPRQRDRLPFVAPQSILDHREQTACRTGGEPGPRVGHEQLAQQCIHGDDLRRIDRQRRVEDREAHRVERAGAVEPVPVPGAGGQPHRTVAGRHPGAGVRCHGEYAGTDVDELVIVVAVPVDDIAARRHLGERRRDRLVADLRHISADYRKPSARRRGILRVCPRAV
jgi:hypothetical protein